MKDKYIVEFAKKTNDLYSVIARKRIKEGQRDVTYKNKTCPIDYGCVMARRGRLYRIMIDVDTGLQVKVEGTKQTIDGTVMNLISGERMGSQIVKTIGQSMSIPWLWLIVGIGVGVPVGIIVGQFVDFASMTGGVSP